MPRREQKRREKAGKVSLGGAWERKRGWNAPLGAGKKRKSGKSKTRRGMRKKKGHGREKGAGMPRREQRRKEEKVCLQTIRK